MITLIAKNSCAPPLSLTPAVSHTHISVANKLYKNTCALHRKTWARGLLLSGGARIHTHTSIHLERAAAQCFAQHGVCYVYTDIHVQIHIYGYTHTLSTALAACACVMCIRIHIYGYTYTLSTALATSCSSLLPHNPDTLPCVCVSARMYMYICSNITTPHKVP